MKVCSKCGEAKPLAAFCKDKTRPDGHFPWCRECKTAIRKAKYAEAARLSTQRWRAANKDYIRTKARECYYPNRNRAKLAANNRRYQERHPERVLATKRSWCARNPAKSAEYDSRRRAHMLAVEVNDFTAAQWQETLAYFSHACAYCLRTDVPLTIEHMTPVSRGGSHTASNIIPACKSCNCSKHARTVLEFVAGLSPSATNRHADAAE